MRKHPSHSVPFIPMNAILPLTQRVRLSPQRIIPHGLANAERPLLPTRRAYRASMTGGGPTPLTRPLEALHREPFHS